MNIKALISGTALAICSSISLQAQTIPAYNSEALNARLASSNDTVYVVNYWATWCIPCVKELPYFEKLAEKYKYEKVKVLLVNFDFKEQYPKGIANFVSKKKLTAEVVWFSESKPNDFIPKIAPEWSGALPATTFSAQKGKKRVFEEGEVNFEFLDQTVQNLLKQ